MTDKSFIKSPWTISIGTAIFSLILTMLYDYFKSNPILTTIIQLIKFIWNGLISLLTFELKMWWIILFTIVVIIIIHFAKKTATTERILPFFYNYNQEKFKKWLWSWTWQWEEYKNAWLITNLTAHCPKCETALIENSSRYRLSFNCPRCDFQAYGEECDEPFQIERLILDNVERDRKQIATNINNK